MVFLATSVVPPFNSLSLAMVYQSSDQIKKPILFALSLTFLLLFGIFVYGTYYLLQEHVTDKVRDKLANVKSLLASVIKEETSVLNGALESIMADGVLAAAFVAQDREGMLQTIKTHLAKVGDPSPVNSFIFYDRQGIAFLRTQGPTPSGESTGSLVLEKSIASHEPASGIELATSGKLNLRVVQPWRHQGELLGYLETGKEIGAVIDNIHQILNTDIVLFIAKKGVDKAEWQKSGGVGELRDWDLLQHYVIVKQTMNEIPTQLIEFLKQLVDCSGEAHLNSILRLRQDQQIYRGGIMPVFNANGEDVGDMTVVVDVTKDETSLMRVASMAAGACFLLGSSLFVVFTLFLGRLQNRLFASRQKLRDEIAERVRAEENLLKQKDFLFSVINSVSHPFYVIDVGNRVISLANKASGILNYPEGVTCYQLSHHRDRPCGDEDHPCTIDRIMATGKSVVLEHIHYDANGRRRYIEIYGHPVFDRQGKIVQVIEHCLDITLRRMTEDDLRQAKIVADEANRAKSQFLANMSHEIRTPMNGILGFTSLLLGMEMGESQREHLGLIKRSADRLLDIVTDILDFSRIEAGKIELVHEPFRLAQLLSDSIGVLAVKAHEKNLELIYFIDRQAPAILIGDAGRLRQIIINLVNNAIKFTDQGEIEVRVEVVAGPAVVGDGQQCLRISVRDTGIGVPPEKRKVIFDSFSQADGSMSRKYGGTGLGLAICKQLIKLMGGEIWAQSNVGQGALFAFTVCLDLPPEVSGAHPGVEAELAACSVLIVDDNATTRAVFGEMLVETVSRFETAADGHQALAILGRQQFDVLVVDAAMSEMDGVALIREVRRNPALARLGVVMLRDMVQAEDIRSDSALGIGSRLYKPVSREALLAAILRVMASERRALSGCTRKKSALPALGAGAGKGGLRRGRQPAKEIAAAVPMSQDMSAMVLKVRILLAEDDPINQTLALALLEDQGYQVVAVDNGRKVLEIVNDGFDLVLLDVQMPVMDGLETSRAIREQEKGTGRRLPIIAMTAHAMRQDRKSCLEAGMDDYIAKPIHAGTLYETLARYHRR